MIRPTKNPITLKFGSTKSPYSEDDPHKGTDFSANPDPHIYKMFDGPVKLFPWNGKTKEGNMATESEGNFRFAHCHIEKFLVKDGQYVKKGTPVAVMGYTGYVVPQGENGRHLHTTARRNGILFDLETLTFEEEDMFNEGDRKNINNYLYGKDLGLHKEAVGKPWKEAMYHGVFETEGFRFQHRVNDGDIANINGTLGGDASKSKGLTWKEAAYNYFLKQPKNMDADAQKWRKLKELLGS